MSCSKYLDYRVKPCPIFDTEDCIDKSVITTCRVLSNNPRIPCIRYVCEVPITFMVHFVFYKSFSESSLGINLKPNVEYYGKML